MGHFQLYITIYQVICQKDTKLNDMGKTPHYINPMLKIVIINSSHQWIGVCVCTDRCWKPQHINKHIDEIQVCICVSLCLDSIDRYIDR